MRCRRRRAPAVLAGVVVTAAALLVMAAAPAGALPRASGDQGWSQRYNGAADGQDDAVAMALSRNGASLVVTGYSAGAHGLDYVTVAYNPATGARQWAKRYNGPGDADDRPHAIAMSHDNEFVAVTGQSVGADGNDDFATVVYDISTGDVVWVRRYDGPGGGDDAASAVGFAADGTNVFVTGTSRGASTDDFATIAYNIGTGARVWLKRFDGPGSGADSANAMAVSPDSATVVITGSSLSASGNNDITTVAYAAGTGQLAWKRLANGPANLSDSGSAIAIASDNSIAVVTGSTTGTTNPADPHDYQTLAYNLGTGARLWSVRFNGPADKNDLASLVGITPDNATVVVGGISAASTGQGDWLTIAYSTTTGARQWVKRFNGTANDSDIARGLAIDPNGTTVVVTGSTDGSLGDYATIAYDIGTGAPNWTKTLNGTGNSKDTAAAVVITPDENAFAIVTGTSVGTSSGPPAGDDFLTVQYTL